jgi:hypothetical protein
MFFFFIINIKYQINATHKRKFTSIVNVKQSLTCYGILNKQNPNDIKKWRSIIRHLTHLWFVVIRICDCLSK